jgi:hypothetical protein
LYARIFYAGWRDDSGCDMQYVHPDTIQPTIVSSITKGQDNPVINRKVVTLEDYVRERCRQTEGHESEGITNSAGIVGVRKDNSKEGNTAQNVVGAVEDDSDSDIDEFTDAPEHPMIDKTAHESPCPVVPAVDTSCVVEPTNAADTGRGDAVNEISQLAGIEQCGIRDPLIAFCCRDSAIMFWSRLMGLPCELRDMVYAAYFADLPSTIILHPELGNLDDHFPSIVPPLCYVNKQTFAESIVVFLRDTQIIVGHHSPAHDLFTEFLDRIPENKGYKAITKLQIDGVYGLPYPIGTPYISSASRLFYECSGLQHHSIAVDAISFIGYPSIVPNDIS